MRCREDDCGFLVARTHRALQNALAQGIKTAGATFEQWQVLLSLCNQDGLPQNVLAERMNVEPSYMTRMLQQAEKDGLIVRTRTPEDARVQLVGVTPRGRALWEKLAAIREQHLEATLACLSPEEARQLKNLLDRVFHFVKESEPQHG
jgi:DNA-binding MarR family transcriptional regulator